MQCLVSLEACNYFVPGLAIVCNAISCRSDVIYGCIQIYNAAPMPGPDVTLRTPTSITPNVTDLSPTLAGALQPDHLAFT